MYNKERIGHTVKKAIERELFSEFYVATKSNWEKYWNGELEGFNKPNLNGIKSASKSFKL